MAVRAIPEGYGTITPYLVTKDAVAEIEYLRKAFDGQELFRAEGPDGSIMHGELMIGDSRLMISEATEQYPASPGAFYLYVEDVDAVFKRAVSAGATPEMEPEDQFYGDRQAGVRDPGGNRWWIATHVEDVAPEEMERRQQEWLAKRSGESGAEVAR